METFKRVNDETEKRFFKENVSIADYALNKLGYTVDKEKDSRNNRVLVKGDEEIVVNKLKGTSQFNNYFSRHDPADRGDIFRFVMSRENANMGEARKLLRDFTGTVDLSASQRNTATAAISDTKAKPATGISPDEQSVIVAQILKLKPTLHDTSYLNSRGVSKETLENPAFQGRIFNNTHNGHTNTAFPIYGKSGMISIEQKNEGFSGLSAGAGGNGLWISNNSDGLPKDALKKLVVAESGIDALSHHQLNHKKGENTMYVSTVGNLSPERMDLLQTIIDKRKPEQVVVATDNDNAGIRYNINLMNTLEPPRLYVAIKDEKPVGEPRPYIELEKVDKVPVVRHKDVEFSAVQAGRYDTTLNINISHARAEDREKMLNTIKDHVSELNRSGNLANKSDVKPASAGDSEVITLKNDKISSIRVDTVHKSDTHTHLDFTLHHDKLSTKERDEHLKNIKNTVAELSTDPAQKNRMDMRGMTDNITSFAVVLKHDDKMQGETIAQAVKNTAAKKETPDGDLKFTLVNTTDQGFISLQLQFKNKDLPLAEKLAVELKQNREQSMGLSQAFLVRDAPKLKDFNDDLKQSLGMPVKEKAAKVEKGQEKLEFAKPDGGSMKTKETAPDLRQGGKNLEAEESASAKSRGIKM